LSFARATGLTEYINNIDDIIPMDILLRHWRGTVCMMPIPSHVSISEGTSLLCKILVVAVFSIMVCLVVNASLLTTRNVRRTAASILWAGLLFLKTMCKVGQGLEFTTFMADVEGLIAVKDIFKEVMCHLPVSIFLARRILE